MTATQYNNVVRWTLANTEAGTTADSVKAAKSILDNCGVAFPKGTCREILLTLMSERYMGWTPCTCAQAQESADAGIAAVGVDADRVVVILPNQAPTCRVAAAVPETASAFAKQADQMAPAERLSMQFFSYSSASTTTTTKPSQPQEPEPLMTRDEYYNNIHSTPLIPRDGAVTYCNIWVHNVLDKCGIPYPTGGCTAELNQYASGFDAWMECGFQDAQHRANEGKATIGITWDHVVMVTPNNGTIPSVIGDVLVSQSGWDCFYDTRLAYSWTTEVRDTIRFFYYNK